MPLSDADRAFIEQCEARNIADPQELGLGLGRLHAILMRARGEERGRIMKLLNPAPPSAETQDASEHRTEGDGKLAQGARLAEEFQRASARIT